MVALVVLINKAIKSLLVATQDLRTSCGAQNPRPLDRHYETIRTSMQAVFGARAGSLNIDNYFFKLRVKALSRLDRVRLGLSLPVCRGR
jgi:hypothetical protein